MNRIELAEELKISRSTLYRKMEKLNSDFRKSIFREVLMPEDVKYIYENIQHSQNTKSGSI